MFGIEYCFRNPCSRAIVFGVHISPISRLPRGAPRKPTPWAGAGRVSDFGPWGGYPGSLGVGPPSALRPPLVGQAAKNSCFARFFNRKSILGPGRRTSRSPGGQSYSQELAGRPQHPGAPGPSALALTAPALTAPGPASPEGGASPRQTNQGRWAPPCFHSKSSTCGQSLTHCTVQ